MAESKSEAFARARKELPRLRATYKKAKERLEWLRSEYQFAVDSKTPWHEIESIKRAGEQCKLDIERLRKDILSAEDAVYAMGLEPKVRLDPDESERLMRGR